MRADLPRGEVERVAFRDRVPRPAEHRQRQTS